MATMMNTTIREVFRRGRFQNCQATDEEEVTDAEEKRSCALNLSIREYFKPRTKRGAHNTSDWERLPEFPGLDEVFDPGREKHHENVEIEPNKINGPYESRAEYLETQYRLLREDAVSPLRDAISEIQFSPGIMESESSTEIYIYDKAYITGFTLASSGIAARLAFSTARVGKRVNWEQSKRLQTGTLIAMSTMTDGFKSICRTAVVAARPLAGLAEYPPTIDVFFLSRIEIDPQQEWIIVESRQGFYEGHRHVLMGLQKMMQEEFPLEEHIVSLQSRVAEASPSEIEDLLGPITLDDAPEPNSQSSTLDPSQRRAVDSITKKRLSIIQGPPGTGKTYVSEIALRQMLTSCEGQQPAILVCAFTNHALDQLLRKIASFEPEFIRLGAMSHDTAIIKPRTLYEIKKTERLRRPAGGLRATAMARIKRYAKDFSELLKPLNATQTCLDAKIMLSYEVITPRQHESLLQGAKEWETSFANADDVFAVWLGDQLIDFKRRKDCEIFGIELEEPDLEYEQLRETEAERKSDEDDDFETLKGAWICVDEKYTGCKSDHDLDSEILQQLKCQDFYQIEHGMRGPVYRYLQTRLKAKIRDKVQEKARQYEEACHDARVGRYEIDYNILQKARVIGLTMNGMAKYRGLLQSLKPRIVLIEEAAEALEPYVTIACLPSIKQLILVGDHQQLRGRCHVAELEHEPFNFDVSLFERLVTNGVEYCQLMCQRRMNPEISAALAPLYPNLSNHESVFDRAGVQGMGGTNSFFFCHTGSEMSDNLMSKINVSEAEMVAVFVEHLIKQGNPSSHITILTFYNGQRKLILRLLRTNPRLANHRFHVATVDSYQGEENEVVILSLVRSNNHKAVGFLDNVNRICVAISRARRGFYLFGDGEHLCQRSLLWYQVCAIMAGSPQIANQAASPSPSMILPSFPQLISGKYREMEKDSSSPSSWENSVRIGHVLPLHCDHHKVSWGARSAHEIGQAGCGCGCSKEQDGKQDMRNKVLPIAAQEDTNVVDEPVIHECDIFCTVPCCLAKA